MKYWLLIVWLGTGQGGPAVIPTPFETDARCRVAGAAIHAQMPRWWRYYGADSNPWICIEVTP